MARITERLDVVVDDMDARRITREHFLAIVQDAINNGDILLPENTLMGVAVVMPLLDKGLVKPSDHSRAFEERMNTEFTAEVAKLRRETAATPRRWWQFWK